MCRGANGATGSSGLLGANSHPRKGFQAPLLSLCRTLMRSFAIQVRCAAVCLACSPTYEPKPLLATYSRLKCSSLAASYEHDLNRAVDSGATAIDPTLGWTDRLSELKMCAAPQAESLGYCRALHGYLRRYTAFQERPLDLLGADEAFRGLYDHSLGAAVLVRAVRSNGKSFVVAKVLERGPGPLGWITSRQLSDAEWRGLQRAAARLPRGNAEYFPRLKPLRRAAPTCEKVDGASVQIETVHDGALQVLSGDYETSDRAPCSGACCEPDSSDEALSRFFDHLAGLIECAHSPPLP